MAVADLQHVGIVPMAWFCIGRQLILSKPYPRHRIPGVAYIAGRSPQVAANVGAPFPNVQAAILAKAVYDGTPGRLKSVAHLLIDSRHLFVGVKRSRSAPIVLKVVDAPGGIGASVLIFMAVAAFIPRAGVGPGR